MRWELIIAHHAASIFWNWSSARRNKDWQLLLGYAPFVAGWGSGSILMFMRVEEKTFSKLYCCTHRLKTFLMTALLVCKQAAERDYQLLVKLKPESFQSAESIQLFTNITSSINTSVLPSVSPKMIESLL